MMAEKIVYYHGCFVNYFDHETGMAAVKTLENADFKVEVPEIKCCGFPLLNSGAIDAGEKRAIMLVEALEGFAREGYDIVYSCPTCGHTLKEVYPHLLESEAAQMVADRVHPLTAYLLQLHKQGRLDAALQRTSLRIAYHTPCHYRSQGLTDLSAKLLNLIPGVEALHLDRGCCGMGGTWALRSKRKSRLSEEIGARLFEEIMEMEPDLVATECAGCQIQIARFTGLNGDRVVHPLRILAGEFS